MNCPSCGCHTNVIETWYRKTVDLPTKSRKRTCANCQTDFLTLESVVLPKKKLRKEAYAPEVQEAPSSP